MEGNENSCELNSNSLSSNIVFIATMETFSKFSCLCSDPLFSSIVALYSLILVYFPHLFLRIVLSPVLILTGALLLTLLRLGAAQRTGNESNENRAETEELKSGKEEEEEDHESVTWEAETDSEPEMGFDPDPCFEDSFVQWDVRVPLEVIYEEYEGEEGEDPNPNKDKETRSVVGLERYPSLSLYYPETDSDSSSDGDFTAFGRWDSPENMCFRWDEEDREGLIEIALDGKKRSTNDKMMDFQVEEENLIEIDISPSISDEFSGEKW